jgi:hypothetical protein
MAGSSSETIPLTIRLSPAMAARLKAAADARNRPAAEIVLDLLDRYLPQAQSGKAKQDIPYS